MGQFSQINQLFKEIMLSIQIVENNSFKRFLSAQLLKSIFLKYMKILVHCERNQITLIEYNRFIQVFDRIEC